MDFIMLIEKLNFSNMIWQIVTPLIFSLFDVITGYIQAIINNNVDSQKMRTGLLHKILIILVIILSFILQFTFNISYISSIVCIYVIVMEVVSILENLKKAGLDLGKLGDILKEKSENTTQESIEKLVDKIDNKESE